MFNSGLLVLFHQNNVVVMLCGTRSGVHNDNEEEEGKGRSVNRPRARLKFQNFPTVVALLSLEQWRNVHALTGHMLRS